MNAPRVTVIIPTYNCLRTLPEALASVREQVLPVEIIVIDDGSTDGTREWLAQQVDINVITSNHQGVAAARNSGIAQAKGKYIAFLDADDYWQTGKLSQQLALHDAKPDLAFSFTDYWYFVDGARVDRCGFADWPAFSERLAARSEGDELCYFEQFLSLLFVENMVGTSTVIARRDLLLQVGGFDTELQSASDWDMWLALAALGGVGVVNSPLCDYTFMREGSISKNLDARAAALKQILNKHVDGVRHQPGVCLRGYHRWVQAVSEAKRCQGKHLSAIITELGSFIMRPHWRSLKVMAGDTLRLINIRR